mmetsp:Transcript_28257/g.79778  ORF Transcript_28257/g.79778 Transcript_28257/m.79778 type:complete len:215 (+) Transcript_28257:344-988(+)
MGRSCEVLQGTVVFPGLATVRRLICRWNDLVDAQHIVGGGVEHLFGFLSHVVQPPLVDDLPEGRGLARHLEPVVVAKHPAAPLVPRRPVRDALDEAEVPGPQQGRLCEEAGAGFLWHVGERRAAESEVEEDAVEGVVEGVGLRDAYYVGAREVAARLRHCLRREIDAVQVGLQTTQCLQRRQLAACIATYLENLGGGGVQVQSLEGGCHNGAER